MRYVVGVILGFLSGVLIYWLMMAFITFLNPFIEPSGALVAATLFGGWAVSTWVMVRGTETTWRVLTRGSLIGAAEWLAVIPVGMIFAGQAVASSGAQTDAELAGAAIGGGLVSIVTGGVAVAMVVLCLLVFVVAFFLQREMQKETAGT